MTLSLFAFAAAEAEDYWLPLVSLPLNQLQVIPGITADPVMFVLLEMILRSSKDSSTTLQAMNLLTHLTHPSRYQLAAAGQNPTMAANLPMLGAVVSSSKACKAASFSFAQWCMATKLQLSLAVNIFNLVNSGKSAAGAVAPQTAPAASRQQHHLWEVISAVISAGLHVAHATCSTLAAMFNVMPLVPQLRAQYSTPAAVAAAADAAAAPGAAAGAAASIFTPSGAAAGNTGAEGCSRPPGSLAALVKQLVHVPGAGGCDQQECSCWGVAGSNKGKLPTNTMPSSQEDRCQESICSSTDTSQESSSSSSSTDTTTPKGSSSSGSLSESRREVGSLDLDWLAGVMDLLGSAALVEAGVVVTEGEAGHLEEARQQQQHASTAIASQQDRDDGVGTVRTEGGCGRQRGVEQQQVSGPLATKEALRDGNVPRAQQLQQLSIQLGLIQAMEEAAGGGGGGGGSPLIDCIGALHHSIEKVFNGPVKAAVPLLYEGMWLCKHDLDRQARQAGVFRDRKGIRGTSVLVSPIADAFARAPLSTFAAQLNNRLYAGFCCNNLGCSNLEGWSEMGQVGGRKGAGFCGRCWGLVYCSKACQEQHWREGHKDICCS